MRIDELLPPQFLVSGTDTNVGKTIIASMLATGLKATYWKPIQSGLDEPTDTEMVRILSGLPEHLILPEAYRLRTPVSPHASAAIDGITIDTKKLELPPITGRLIIEGAGGVMVPVNDDNLLIDIIKSWGLPVLLVASTRLGTINHTLLSLTALRSKNIAVVGVVMNGSPDEISRLAIERYGKTTVLATIPPLRTVNTETIRTGFEQYFSGEDF
ncbi:MAG: dethiobiotin synthase [Proteobacteria bacterium]|nr:dethiobiotin synthase [Desulfobulbaceae bacterium]MBU4151361.1 dethiobiotin synthase [Pseudomonadota bacterium]MDP2106752.1 dethiobiotin synthase [Desulfobulbaceae bacterium]